MSIFYQRVVAIALMVASCCLVQAQKLAVKTDKIYRLDKTVIENVRVTEVNQTDIYYQITRDPNKVYVISRKDIWKIEWNTGENEEITPIQMPSVAKPVKATDLLVRKTTVAKIFWARNGPFAGAAAGAGLGSPAKSDGKLTQENQLVYSGGLTVGYRWQAVGIQLDALYTKTSYLVTVPEYSQELIRQIRGNQSQILLPLNVTASRMFGKARLGLSAGGFANVPLGGGSLKVDYPEAESSHTKNCGSCSGKDPAFGIMGGVTATLIENSFSTIYVNVRYYYNLRDNKDFRVGETGVNIHAVTAGAGILFHFPKSGVVK